MNENRMNEINQDGIAAINRRTGELMTRHHDDSNTMARNREALPEILSVKQAADLLGSSESYVRILCRQGRIRSVKLGKNWKIGRDALIKQMDLLIPDIPRTQDERPYASTAETVEIIIRIEVPAELAERLANTKVIVSTAGRPTR